MSAGNHVSVFPYPGGKGRMCDWIISRMPPHECYVEVFGGSAALLYNKPAAHNEVYNDINDDLVQFFSVLREREEELLEWLQGVPYARSVYDEWAADFYLEGHRPEDPIERAGRFFTLRHMQFAGDNQAVNGFKTRHIRSPARTFANARDRIHELAGRFREVVIENRDFREILEGYDADYDDPEDADVLFYCDPPYVGSEHYYALEFDHAAFVDALKDVDARWMVSYTTLPDGLEEYHVLERTRRHRMARGDSVATERLICNFDPDLEPSFVDVNQRQEALASFTEYAEQGGDDT